jgi:hypothetical protein
MNPLSLTASVLEYKETRPFPLSHPASVLELISFVTNKGREDFT